MKKPEGQEGKRILRVLKTLSENVEFQVFIEYLKSSLAELYEQSDNTTDKDLELVLKGERRNIKSILKYTDPQQTNVILDALNKKEEEKLTGNTGEEPAPINDTW